MSDNPDRPRPPISASAACPRAAKRGMVRAVFDSVAPRYDLMNDLMSLGVHRAWKHVLRRGAGSPPRGLAGPGGGTGDIGFGGWSGRRAGDADRRQPAMLQVAQDRALARGLSAGVAAGRGCRTAAAAGPQRGQGLDRVRPAQLHRQAGGAARGAPRAAAGRAVLLPGILAGWRSRRCGRSTTPGRSACCRCWARAWRGTRRAIGTWPRASGCSPTRRRWRA